MFEFVVMLFFVVAIIGTFTSILSFADYSSDIGTIKPVLFCGSVGLISWLAFAILLGYNFDQEVKPLTVHTIDNIDVVVYDGKLINLNDKFKRDFAPGETNFEFIKEQYVYGLYHNGTLVKPE